MVKNMMVGVANEAGVVRAYAFRAGAPSKEARLLAEQNVARMRFHRMVNNCPGYILDAPNGVSEFFEAEWDEPETELFMYCQTTDGWYGVYRNEYGQSPRIPLVQFSDLYDEWLESDSQYRFDQYVVAAQSE